MNQTVFQILGGIWQIFNLLCIILILAASVYLFLLLTKALRKYLQSQKNSGENAILKKSLGEVIREYRMNRSMTQEFVAESLGVSRQAVSKWESGASAPSTANLFALAKLFGVPAEELIHKVNTETDHSD